MDFLAIGGSEEVFWTLTPRSHVLHQEAARKRLEREGKIGITQAWWNAKLSRAENVPSLQSLLEPAAKLTSEEVVETLRSITHSMPVRSWAEWQSAQ